MNAPSVDYAAVAPMLIVFVAALLAVLVEAFAPRTARFVSQVVLASVGIAAALISVVYLGTQEKSVTTAGGAVVIDGPALFLQGTILVLGLMALLTMADEAPESGAFTAQASAVPGSVDEARAARAGLVQTEVYPLILFSMVGMLLFPASNDLLTMFIALEVLSLPLYLLCGLARRRRLLSQEASLKYFLLGAFSSAFFLFGSALLYGFAGSVRLSDIAAAISDGSTGTAASAVVGKDGLLLLGVGLLAVGLLFKVGAFPFQSWTPDVYQGAPTPVTGFMAACTKVAAFGALLRIAYVALPGVRWDWQPVIWVVAALTMLIGSIIAIVQADVKRMLAYSSIAHAGFILVGLLAMDRDGIGSVLFYLAAYGFTTVGAFALVTLVRTSTPEGGVGGEATHLSQWQGLAKRSPLLAFTFTLFLLAFAGIPLTSGFTGKFAVFSAAVDQAPWGPGLVLVGVAASAIAVFFYIRVIVLMYFNDSVGDAVTVTRPGALTIFAVGVGVVATIGLGVLPAAALQLANSSSVFLP
ncbi:NADH-quinone oxidoreductase subunit NuoN [Kineosporia rhizophila]|uniref:NADH-quinone oxidoreductase subunit NuoN n=2 Tax=Kineosporia TaxID=49184 RepID=UPI001E4B9549|nr:NADH-quinone oxidoreductase subunit NuoN [Kineosporia sp. NBRC 101677]MCE0540548.1 NADH-quinone oxidoreductase subunit NuoN [Kineosporia rhizophila]GLY13272.1 NADH-quinone oxidoreductase subunit N [Kineosporia sp. NBRC 101677]